MRRSLQLLAWAAALGVILVGVGCYSTWVSSGLLYIEQNDWAKAEKMFRTALWYNAEEAAAHYQLAFAESYRARNEHLNKGEMDSVRIKLQEAFDHYLLAKQYAPEKYGYDETVEREEERTPAENGIASNYAWAFNKAVTFNKNEQYDEAITYFDLAYLSDPRGENGFNARTSYIKLRINQSEGSETVVNEMLAELDKLKPPSNEFLADLVQTKAQALQMVGRNAEAAQLYEDLLRDNPDDIALLGRVAQGRIEEGDRQGAAELFERIASVVEQSPDMPMEARFEYVYAGVRNYFDAEEYDKCLALAERALALATEPTQRARVLRMTARSEYEMERYPEAVTLAEDLLDIEPENPSAWQIYYLSLFRAGRETDAQEARARYMELSGASGSR